jgi:spermidine/putrescine transport system permease protein
LEERRPGSAGLLLSGPGLLWLVVFFAIPLAMLLGYSFLPRTDAGGVARGFTLEHYRELLDPLYLNVLYKTVLYAAWATIACLLIGYPCAYAIVRAGRMRRLLLFLFVLPFWTSFLVRTYSLIFLMRDGGLVNDVLLRLHWIDQPLELLYRPAAVIVGLVHGFLPFMLLPIYASLEKLDWALLDAASALGARPVSQFLRVTLPLTLPGVLTGCVLVFIPSLGSFLTSDLLGGSKEVLIGNLVQNQFTSARNWPLGAAASMLLILLVIGVMLVKRPESRNSEFGADAR